MVQAPKRGEIVTVNGKRYRVLKVYPFGTMDAQIVASPHRADVGRAVRLTGLGWIAAKADAAGN